MRILRKIASLLVVLSMVFSGAVTFAFADGADLSDSDVTGISGETCAEAAQEENGVQTLAGNITWHDFTAGSEEELRELLESGKYTNMGVEITLTGDIELTSGFTGFYQMPEAIRIIGTDSQGVKHTLKGPEGGRMFTQYSLYDEYTTYATLILDDIIVDCNGGVILYASYGAVGDFEMHNAEIRNGCSSNSYPGVISLGDGYSYNIYTDEMVNVTLDNVTTSNCTGTLLSTIEGDVAWNISNCNLSSTANGLGSYSDCVWYVLGSATEDRYTEPMESVISNSTFSWSDGENGESFKNGIYVSQSSVLTVKDSTITGPTGENDTFLFTVVEDSSWSSYSKWNGLNLENCSLENADASRPVIDVMDREATIGLGSDVNGEPEVFFASGSNGSAGKLQISDRLTGTIYFDYGVSLSGAGFTLASAGEGYTITKEDRRCLQYAGEETGYMVILDEENNELLFAQGTPADKTGLDEKIAEAEEVTDEGYTTGSWAALQEALDEAKKVSADDSATQDEVTEAIEALDEAMAGLTEAADKSALDAEIARAEALNEKDYTADSWSNMQDVLDAAKEVSADGNADQDDVDAITIALADAIDALEVKVEADKTALRAEIEEAESLNKGDYTENSWSALQTALTAAKEVMDDESADQEAVDEALTDLSHAVMALQSAGVTGFMRNGSDGNWYYYVNSIRQSKLNSVVSGTVNGQDGWWYVVGGQVQIHYTGVSNYSNAYGWWYIKDGKVDFSCDSVEQNDYGWWYVAGGKVDFSYTGVANYSNANGWWYISGGKVDFSKTGIEQNNYGWWRVVGGKVDFGCNSVEQNDYGWWYLVGGQVQFDYTGVANYANANGWWYISGGKVDFSKSGIEQNNYGWWRVVGGKVDFGCNSVEQNDYGWWYVTGGQVQFGYTGVANYANANGWWYISGGKVDFSYTGRASNDYGTWNVVNGKVVF